MNPASSERKFLGLVKIVGVAALVMALYIGLSKIGLAIQHALEHFPR